jgi:hypothetical protein
LTKKKNANTVEDKAQKQEQENQQELDPEYLCTHSISQKTKYGFLQYTRRESESPDVLKFKQKTKKKIQ